jgi:hypothetical protein
MSTPWNFTTASETQSVGMSKTFMANVFAWMFAALSITAFTAYYIASDESILRMMFNETGRTGLGMLVMFAPLIFVLIMSFGLQRLSYPVILTLFIAYSVTMGASLSTVLLVFSAASVMKTFAVCSIMFGVMAVAGYTTQTDLTRLGNILMMGVIGLIIASLINMFTRSTGFDYIISFFGVAIFTGLTAYDVQKLKEIGSGITYPSEASKKQVVMGALSLYLDFINLFMYLLRFFGDRRN